MALVAGKVLMFDSDNANIRHVKSIVRNHFSNMLLTSFAPDETSVQTCSREKPDIIIVDTVSSGFRGVQVCHEIKQHSHLSGIPLIAIISAGNQHAGEVKIWETGVDACLQHPVNKFELIRMLELFLHIKFLEGNIHHDQKALLNKLAHSESELADHIKKSKLTEESLQIEIDFVRQILQAMGQGLTITNDEGRFQYANPAFIKLIGYESEEVLGKRPYDFTLQEDHDMLREARKVRKAGRINSYETKLKHKNGGIIDVTITGVPYYKGGEIAGSIAVITDISELKNTTKKLKKLSDEYECIFNATQDAMFLIKVLDNQTFRYIRTNKAHQKLTGLTLEMIAGKTPEELLGEQAGKVYSTNYARCIEQKRPIIYEEIAALPAGEEWWRTSLTPVFDNGKPIFIVGASTNISETKKLTEHLMDTKDTLSQQKRKKILVAEDEEVNFDVLHHMLSMLDVDIMHAKNGAEAVAFCRQDDSISLVIMDVQMPVMDGLTATKEIKAFRPGLPILALTAYAMTGDKEKALAHGCDDYLSKPVLLKPLLLKVKQML